MAARDYGTPFSVTATHATAAVASKTGVAKSTHYITQVAVSSDKAGAILLIKQGTTVIWQEQIGADDSGIRTFDPPLVGDLGALVSVEIDGTSACKANINGFTLTQP